jgi:hypothetical protein
MSRRALPALMLLGGCYGYYPPNTPAPVGRDVAVTLTDSGSFALARQVGPSAEAINGRFTADSGNAIVLSVRGVRQRDGNDVGWRGERLIVPRPLVVKVEERRFSRTRTAVFGGALVVSLVALRQAFGGEGFSFFGNGQPKQTGTK